MAQFSLTSLSSVLGTMRADSASARVLQGLGPGLGSAGKKHVMMKAIRPKDARHRKNPCHPPALRTELLRTPTRRLLMMSLVNKNP